MKIIIVILIGLALAGSVYAHTGHDEHDAFEQAEAIINANISCESLSDEQLEVVGDYYMEQMHPGEAHEQMDTMMGGEGSESLKLMHINMAKRFYCGDDSTSMMNMMGSSGMMNYNHNSKTSGFSATYFVSWLGFIALGALVFGLIFWSTYKLVMKKK